MKVSVVKCSHIYWIALYTVTTDLRSFVVFLSRTSKCWNTFTVVTAITSIPTVTLFRLPHFNTSANVPPTAAKMLGLLPTVQNYELRTGEDIRWHHLDIKFRQNPAWLCSLDTIKATVCPNKQVLLLAVHASHMVHCHDSVLRLSLVMTLWGPSAFIT